MAQALARLLRLSVAQRREMGQRGRALALARHAPAVAGRRYRDLLVEMGQHESGWRELGQREATQREATQRESKQSQGADGR